MAIQETRTVSVSIDRDWREVYAFVRKFENLPLWASGLAGAVEIAGDELIAVGPGGRQQVRFAPENPFGILDHVVTTAAGERVECPCRVVANGSGAVVTFTLFRRPGTTPKAFAADADWVLRDLRTLKALLEVGANAEPAVGADPDNDLRIDYVELTVADIARAKAFYGGALGWHFKDYGPAYCEFTDGRLTGGFAAGDPSPAGGPLIVLFAVDLAATQRRLEAVGAVIVKPAFGFPGGRRFHFRDLDGYEMAVWSDRPE